jgi:hypothetical protein
MTVTFGNYNNNGSGTYVNPNQTITDPKTLLVTKLTATTLEYNVSSGGTSFTLAAGGQFDLSRLTTPLITGADVDAAVANNTLTGTINSFVASTGGTYAITQTYSPGLSLPLFGNYVNGTSLAVYSSVLSGNDVYYASATATPTGGAWDGVYLYGGNDMYYQNHVLMTYNDIFYGGEGIDTAVLPGKAANYKIQASNSVWDSLKNVGNLSGFVITDNTKAINTLQVNQVERLKFLVADPITGANGVALDIGKDQTAGSDYMLYKAAFNRVPDPGGLGFWMSKMDGNMSYATVAQNFVNSQEFKDAYGGSNPTVNTLVTKLYNNVLNRVPDAGGLAFWKDNLTNGGWTTADVLGFFSTSDENVANVASLIAKGIPYTEWVG